MAENRAKLVGAARRAFAAQGYAAWSMDELTAKAGLTRGALYHSFGGKKGLLWAVVEQIDEDGRKTLHGARAGADPVLGPLDEGTAYIEMAVEPETQRIMLLDGPALLGDPSK
jgi:AcrR family transcriptional regulator